MNFGTWPTQDFPAFVFPFLSQHFLVSCRGLTIESPTRYACSDVGVSECRSLSAVNLLVSGILNFCGCPALLVGFVGDLGSMVALCGAGVVVVVIVV